MKIIETTFPVVEIMEPRDPAKQWDLEELEEVSADPAKREEHFVSARKLTLEARKDMAGRSCFAIYDRTSDTLFVKYTDTNVNV